MFCWFCLASRARRARAFVAVVALAGLGACRRHHVPVDAMPAVTGDLGCTPDDGGAAERVAVGHIRSGPISNDPAVNERFELRRGRCGYVFRSRQEWPLAISDVEVHYDGVLRPLWAWKRMTIAGSTREDGNADVRRYELRTGDVFIKHRDAGGQVSIEKLLPSGRAASEPGQRVGAVVGPGRGVLTPWLRRARLAVGAKTHELVLDFRSPVETLEVASLERDEDRWEPSIGKVVRVYTFYGRETIFADDDDTVVGDLAGLRPSDTLATPEPPPLPTYAPIDPEHSP